MKTLLTALLVSLPPVAPAGTSADYTLSPATVDAGGGRGTSAAYAADFSQAPGMAGQAGPYTLRSGFAGQLNEAASLRIWLNPDFLEETGTGQLRAGIEDEDGRLTDLSASGVTWSILGGPLNRITAEGAVTASAVYREEIAGIQGTASGLSGVLSFPVAETIPDNFSGYAGDRLPDAWQVRYFGLSEPAGGQTGDPDHDGYNNLLEFAFGTDPTSLASGPGGIIYSGSALVARGQPIPMIRNIPGGVDFRVIFARRRDYLAAGLLYQVQFSPDLLDWTTSTAVPAVIAQDAEFEAVGVTWPFFINGRKARFFRVMAGFTP